MRDDFILEDDIPTTSVEELKKQFYKSVIIPQAELLSSFKRCKVAREPQRLILNPPGFGNFQNVTATDLYIAVYYRGFYVRVEHGKSMFGPHKFELLYQVRKGCQVWLGIKTHKVLFHNQKEIKAKLRLTILAKDFYCAPDTAKTLVNLQTEEQIKKIALDM